MGAITDNLIAYRILKMLVTNFEDTDAFKLGIIDAKGKNLKKASKLQGSDERNAYPYLHRLVFNMKKIINKLPGGESKTRSLVAAMFLIKEHYESGSRATNITLLEEKFNIIKGVLENGAVLVEEEIILKKFLEEEAPANSGGAGIALGGEAGANTGTVAGMDLPLKKGKLAKRKKPDEPLKGKENVSRS